MFWNNISYIISISRKNKEQRGESFKWWWTYANRRETLNNILEFDESDWDTNDTIALYQVFERSLRLKEWMEEVLFQRGVMVFFLVESDIAVQLGWLEFTKGNSKPGYTNSALLVYWWNVGKHSNWKQCGKLLKNTRPEQITSEPRKSSSFSEFAYTCQ